MHNWYWRNWETLSYLTCDLLEPWTHGFFTQPFWPRLPQELTKLWHPEASAYRLQQVHGNSVLTPQEADRLSLNSEHNLAAGDGLISTEPLQAVWVASADCTPVLIGDIRTGQVAAIHAGWRGTAAKIVPTAIARMRSLGSNLADLRVVMGPAIAGEVYQVTVEVAAQICSTIIPDSPPEAILENVHQLPNSPLIIDPDPGKIRLDVRRINSLQLDALGISDEQIAIAPYCTYRDSEHFFSYRRQKQKKVQWSGIISRT
jgi:YfiH family protein